MLTAEKVIAAVRELAAESPEAKYINSVCLYTQGKASNGSCGCLIGQALVKADPEIKAKLIFVDEHDMLNASLLLSHLCVDTTELQENWLDWVQGSQDAGNAWESCVTQADRYYPGV